MLSSLSDLAVQHGGLLVFCPMEGTCICLLQNRHWSPTRLNSGSSSFLPFTCTLSVTYFPYQNELFRVTSILMTHSFNPSGSLMFELFSLVDLSSLMQSYSWNLNPSATELCHISGDVTRSRDLPGGTLGSHNRTAHKIVGNPVFLILLTSPDHSGFSRWCCGLLSFQER